MEQLIQQNTEIRKNGTCSRVTFSILWKWVMFEPNNTCWIWCFYEIVGHEKKTKFKITTSVYGLNVEEKKFE